MTKRLPRRTHTSHATAMLGSPGGFWVTSRNRTPTHVTWYSCLLRDSAWYCIRGLRPKSPSTSTHTRRSVPASRRRNHSVASPVTAARHAAGHAAHEPEEQKAIKTDEIVTNTTREAATAQRDAMFVCDER
ncbi:hypothetical protein EYF80_060813 [Liparis tanakae]|uniref:Uncharacterized protein n=1 Tax=Liparis tanakae TaxID=230148 RepID=A0A4Z2EJR1_9TELE|nr:hypothetical protein EYF80_060813 [Liparis tanakae]